MSEFVIQVATLISVLVGIFGLCVAIYGYRRQMNAQVFIEYNKRFEEVIASFPKGAWIARFNPDEELPAQSEELSLCVLKYLNLCAEEYHLSRSGYLSSGVWKIWEGELRSTLRSPLFRREWDTLAHEFASHAEFREYLQRQQSESSR